MGRGLCGSSGPAHYEALGQISVVTWAHSPVAVNDNPGAEDHEEFRPQAG
jgi:hypothetical protein